MINTLEEAQPITQETGEMERRFKVWTRSVQREASVGDWQSVTFQNGWANFGGTFNSAEFRSLGDKRVEIRGLITGGTIGLVAFTLPVGFRPLADYALPSVSFGAFAQTNINSAGDVTPTVGIAGVYSIDSLVISLD